MTFQDIKNAVDVGRKVFWKNRGYQVLTQNSRYYVIFLSNSNMTGLFWLDDKTSSYDEKDFFMEGE